MKETLGFSISPLWLLIIVFSYILIDISLGKLQLIFLNHHQKTNNSYAGNI